MGALLHGCARTTPRIRAELQASKASPRALARQYGLNPKTVAKWRRRNTTADSPMGPREKRSSTLSPEQEALVVEFRRRTSLALDDMLGWLREQLPTLSRSYCIDACFATEFPDGPMLRQAAFGEADSTRRPSAMCTSITASYEQPTASSTCSWPSTASRSSPTSNFIAEPRR